MDIKEILLAGGRVIFQYKENSEDWVGSAEISANIPLFSKDRKPSIELRIPTIEIKGRKEFPYDQIDDAISLFKKIVFNEKNLCYKKHETLIELEKIVVDLEDKDDFDMYENHRKALINKK